MNKTTLLRYMTGCGEWGMKNKCPLYLHGMVPILTNQ